jgi:hypothetical protein
VLIIVVLALAITVGATGSGNKENCRAAVTAKYPDGRVSLMPDSNYKFIIVLPNGTVRLAKTLNLTNTEISSDEELVTVAPKTLEK